MKSNPFATCFVRPGMLAWEESPGLQLSHLTHRWVQELGGRAAIVGPHGSGKSTLLEHLIPRVGSVCWRSAPGVIAHSAVGAGEVVWLGLRRGQAPFRQVLASRSYWSRGGVLVVDGLEQLFAWQRCLLLAGIPWWRMKLLATCHRPSKWLPTLCRTDGPREVLPILVERLLQTRGDVDRVHRRQLADPRWLQTLLDEEQGNMREVFMRLYDHFENFCAEPSKIASGPAAATQRRCLMPPPLQ
ncbi:MAG: hypothetical protein KDA45_04895 [Planctomycetales bacterium]|nr:hypothetical protein [Planctomycetales bacterium]